MKRKALCALLFALLILLASCSNDATTRMVYTMDTVANYTIMPSDTALADEIEALLFEIEDELSPTNGDLAEINAAGGGVAGVHLREVFSLAERFYEETNGTFSHYLGAPIELWGIGEKNYIPTGEELILALDTAKRENAELSDGKITLRNGAKLNFGAIAKGYATDKIRALLKDARVEGAVVELGGNVYVHGTKPEGELFNVALREPNGKENDWILSLALSDMFIISSGDYERYFEEDGVIYHHILNPETGKPAESDVSAVCVISENGAMGDAYSTALYVMGKDAAISFWRENMGFELVLIGRDGRVTLTEGLSRIYVPNEKKGYSYEIAYR